MSLDDLVELFRDGIRALAPGSLGKRFKYRCSGGSNGQIRNSRGLQDDLRITKHIIR